MGDDLGMPANFCNEFFPTPSDQGICLTKNMDIKEVMYSKTAYDTLFEPLQLICGNSWAETGNLVSLHVY